MKHPLLNAMIVASGAPTANDILTLALRLVVGDGDEMNLTTPCLRPAVVGLSQAYIATYSVELRGGEQSRPLDVFESMSAAEECFYTTYMSERDCDCEFPDWPECFPEASRETPLPRVLVEMVACCIAQQDLADSAALRAMYQREVVNL